QAVDGIRVRNVTGVQTCALPILTTSTTALMYHFHTMKLSTSSKALLVTAQKRTSQSHIKRSQSFREREYNADGAITQTSENKRRSKERRVGKKRKSE